MSLSLIDPHFATLLTTVGDGFAYIQDQAIKLLKVLAMLEIAVSAMWWGFGNNDVVEELLKKVMKIGFYIFLVTSFTSYMPDIMGSFILAGSGAAGGVTTSSSTTFFSPDALISQGLKVGFDVIFGILGEMASSFPENIFFFPVVLVLVLINISIGFYIVFSFAAMAVNVVIITLEFYIVSVLSMLLLPFGVFRYTAIVGGEKSIQAIVFQGIKLMVLTTIITLCVPLFSTVSSLATSIDTSSLSGMVDSIYTAFQISILVMLLKMLVASVPGIANAMMGHGGMNTETADGIAGGVVSSAQSGRAATGALKGVGGKVTGGVSSGVSAVRSATGKGNKK